MMHWPLIVLLTAQGLDVATTLRGLSRGCLEGNPSLVALHITTPVRLSFYNGGLAVTYVWTFKKAHGPSTAPRWRRLLMDGAALAQASEHAVAAWHNARLSCRPEGRSQ